MHLLICLYDEIKWLIQPPFFNFLYLNYELLPCFYQFTINAYSKKTAMNYRFNSPYKINFFLSYSNVERGYSLVKLLFVFVQFYYIKYLKLSQNMHIAIARICCLSNDIGKLLKVKLKQSKKYDLAAEF